MTIKFLYDHIDPEKGIIPNLEPIFGDIKERYDLLIYDIKDKTLLPSYLGADLNNWFYPIFIDRPCHHVDDLIIGDVGSAERSCHFTRKLSTKVMKGLIEKRGWLLLIFAEPMGKEYEEMLVSSIERGRITTQYSNTIIPYDRFIICTQSHDINHSNFFSLSACPYVKIIQEQLKRKTKDYAHKDYMCFNFNVDKKDQYRKRLQLSLEKLNLLDKGYVSANGYCDHYPESISKFVDINLVIETSQKIIANTRHPDSLRLTTEKSYRSFLNKKPFLLFGAAHHLKHLKAKGFKTFDCIFNETYDDIENVNERLFAIMKELLWWTGLDTKDKKELLTIAKPIIEYNYNLIYDKINNEFETALLKVINEYK